MIKLNSEILVLLINLDRAEERRLKMVRQLSNLGINYVRISAIDGKNYKYTKNEYDELKYRRCNGKKNSVGEIGCYLSHHKAIEYFLNTDKKYALILEDDAKLNRDFINILNKLIAIQNTWDFVKFNTSRDGGFGNIVVGELFGDYKLYASLFQKAYAAAYIINRNCFRCMSPTITKWLNFGSII